MLLRNATADSPDHLVEHVLELYKVFLIKTSQLPFLGLKIFQIKFGDKICGSKFWEIFRGFIFAYNETVAILNQIIFDFAIFVLHIFDVLMVCKEQFFIKSPNLQ